MPSLIPSTVIFIHAKPPIHHAILLCEDMDVSDNTQTTTMICKSKMPHSTWAKL